MYDELVNRGKIEERKSVIDVNEMKDKEKLHNIQ